MKQGRQLGFEGGGDNYGERSEPKKFYGERSEPKIFLLLGDNPPEKAKITLFSYYEHMYNICIF